MLGAMLAGCPPQAPCGPQADFCADVTTGEAPLTVQFTDTSILGVPCDAGWLWLFGDGASSTQQDPVHTYTAAGTYAVSLTVTTPKGSDTRLRLNYIAVSDSGEGEGEGEDLQEYPIASEVYTTREQTIVPLAPTGSGIQPWEVSRYAQYGYGQWTYGDGTDLGRLALVDGYVENSPAVTNVARLLHFFTITDIHITDKESPAQLIYLAQFNSGIGNNAISIYSGIMPYTTHVLDAAIQTANALHQALPLDFGISLGDAINSAGRNELRWYIDVIDGQPINPDSGQKDDPIPGPYNDYQDTYKATGLDPSIPWYQVIGNHDQHWMGSKPVDDYLRNAYTSTNILQMGNVLLPGGVNERKFYMGTLDGSTVYAEVYGAGRVENFVERPQVVADGNRRPVTSQEWMGEFLNTTSSPVGHGFTQDNVDRNFACYSFAPKSNLPLKVIALDNTSKPDTPGLDPNSDIFGYGTLDQARYDWLIAELEAGMANNQLMIIAAHVPIGVVPAGSPVGWWRDSYVSEPELIAKLQEYPNLILWIAGHRHLNTITPFESPDAERPELGFWGVETVSLREFPQQFRTFEIVRNSDQTVSILATNVDPAVAEGSLAELSRSYGIGGAQAFGVPYDVSRNAELVVHLTPEMQTVIQDYGTPINQ
jgi:metallophosphoesterase (TIGR03768 family)